MLHSFWNRSRVQASRPVRRGGWGPAKKSNCHRKLQLETLEERWLPSFAGPASYDVGRGPKAVVVGDFNGDGTPDLAVASTTGLDLLLGNGDGSFQPARRILSGSFGDLVAADFIGNGKLDLAVVGPNSGDVGVLLGNGDGTFQTPVDVGQGLNATSLAVGDVNGDGIPDLVSASYSNSTVSVLLGNGDGSFQSAVTSSTGSTQNITALALGDFNGDGNLDVAVTTTNFPLYYSLIILPGNGDGTFRIGPTYNADGIPNSGHALAVGDFNGDGNLDIAIPGSGNGYGNVFLGNGDGTFRFTVGYPRGLEISAVATADVNGDSIPDLVGTSPNSGGIVVLLGNGDGTFRAAGSLGVGGTLSSSLAVADLNGDGALDVAVANPSGNNVSVVLGNGDGSFQTTASIGFDAVPVAADLNGDGIPDLVTPTAVYLGNGDGTFQPPQNLVTGRSPLSVAVADVNGDGIPDLVVANRDVRITDHMGTHYYPGEVDVLLGNGDGTFQAPVTYGPLDARFVAAADFDQDGSVDLVVMTGDINNPTVRNLSVLLGNGDGTFRAGPTYSLSYGAYNAVLGDFNRDGTLDLAFVNGESAQTISVMLGNGDGTFQPPVSYAAPNDTSGLAAGDLNGNGILDLIVTTDFSAVEILKGNGDGTFQSAQSVATGIYPFAVAVADFTGDGVADLAVGGYGGVKILAGNGDGTFQTSDVAYGPDAFSVVVDDVNGDGFPDLISSSGNIYLNGADWSIGPAMAPRQGHQALAMPDDPVAAAATPVVDGPARSSFQPPSISELHPLESRSPNAASVDRAFTMATHAAAPYTRPSEDGRRDGPLQGDGEWAESALTSPV